MAYMSQTTNPKTDSLIDAAIAEHGAMRVLLASLRTLVRQSAAPLTTVEDLDDRLRADIGLPPKIPQPDIWRLMR